jgi:protein SCO1
MRRVGLVALLLAVAVFAQRATSLAGPVVLGDIALVDQTNAPFRLRDLAGRPSAITFVATRCRDTCPIVNGVFAQLARGPLRARLVSVSLDPGYDTPFVIGNFARELQAHSPQWRFVTGHQANVANVLAAFRVTVERGSDGIPDAHSDLIYVLDSHGRLRNTLPLSSHTVADLRRALAQPSL